MMMFSRGIALLQDLGDDAGAHRAAALADREAQLLLHRDRRDQLDRHLRVVPRHHHPPPPSTYPPSIRPVAPVPRPVIENTSSTGIRNGLSTSRFGTGMLLSRAVSSSSTFATHGFSPAIAFRAEPRITGMSSPGYSYFDNSSRTSSSTRSRRSASSTRSHLLRNTTSAGPFTFRANRMCSRVCGIGPSTADTTRIAPSIWAAPVIMFFT